MNTNTLLLIAGALGVGYLIAKKKAQADAKASAAAGVAPRVAAKALPEEGADIVFVEPAVEYVPYPAWGGPWGGSWGGGWRGGGGRHHHHRRRR
jgi:hypothetical protein